VRSQIFLKEKGGTKCISTFWNHTDYGSNKKANEELKELFPDNQEEGTNFPTPKPTLLIQKFIHISDDTDQDCLVLDFFAGSATTADALMRTNSADSGARRYIMVQLPEKLDSEKYKNIAEIGKERIRRAASRIKEENPDYDGDIGFKVFKLDSSNIRAWNPDRNDLEQTLIDHIEHLVEGRSEEDVLYELLLKRGVELTVPIEEKTITGKTVYSIGYGVLFACLDTAIIREEVEDLAHGIIDWHKELEPASDTQVVFRDSAFANDIAKTNMTAILEQHGIAHVRSL
jgi:adenine-specific DNA-methyltransferase